MRKVPCPDPRRTFDPGVEPFARAVACCWDDKAERDEVLQRDLQTARGHAKSRRQVLQAHRSLGLHEREHDTEPMGLAKGEA